MPSIHHFLWNRVLPLKVALIVWLGVLSSIASGQNDLRSSRAELRAKLMNTLLDANLPQAQRLAAGERLHDVHSEEADALLKFAQDTDEDDALRLAAFHGLRVTPRLLSSVLEVVGKATDGGAVLNAGLIEQLRTRFRLPADARARDEVHSVLRGVLDDPRPIVRSGAFRILGEANDPAAVKMLTDGLNDPDAAKIPKAEAVDLLYRAGPRKHLSLFKKFVDDPDPKVLIPVFMALSLDPESRETVVKKLQDGTTPLPARIAAIESLRYQDADFANYAIALLKNNQEDPELRVKAADALVRTLNPSRKNSKESDQIEFYKALSQLSDAADAPQELRAKCRDLCPTLEKGFPAIEKLRSSSVD